MTDKRSDERKAAVESEAIAAMAAFGVHISAETAHNFREYRDLLVQWNQKINLTTVPDAEILPRHFGESLFGAQAAGIEKGNLLDVGSGAGFPGLPIALFRPGVRAVLLESNGKKAAFLTEVVRKLELTDRVKVLRSRLEDYGGDEKRFDFITARAVRVDASSLEICERLLAENGKLVIWQSEADFKRLKKLRGWRWAAPIRIPLTEQKAIISGTAVRDTSVSRET